MLKYLYPPLILAFLISAINTSDAQHSVARQWNEALLHAIRNDYARPTVHARNLFHTSVAMYDAWACYGFEDETFLLGKTVDTFHRSFNGIIYPEDIQAARDTAISFAAYRLLKHRFAGSPGAASSLAVFDALFVDTLGYDKLYTSTDYSSGCAAALGNYIGQCLIDFGLQDGSNEQGNYENQYYYANNLPLLPVVPGNEWMLLSQQYNSWQPISLDTFIDQSGNIWFETVPDFLSPEWGNVVPFALDTADMTEYERGGPFKVYHDPGAPPYFELLGGGLSNEYKWGFELVAIWGSHLDPADSVMVDISPASFGNYPIDSFPLTFPEYRTFYDSTDGGDPGTGHDLNPITGQPYAPQMVLRGDYTRVLAEFWADGPESETPPGHWYTILNYVNDHPQTEKRFAGLGPILNDLEWDVKAYLLLGGAVHDAAIAAWGVKGWYDYVRPISAIRMMAEFGQCSDTTLSNYLPGGIHLRPGLIEVVDSSDVLAGDSFEHVNKIKLYTWKGPDSINNPLTDVAGVGWILAENWWPYQRPTFVTPPFAGYVSGHSTFSRAAAEIMTYLTGDAFFPGGMGEFFAPKDSFLVFEDGPSQDITLQWATYRDASDQTSLSRIWGGIHPPADDIPGRLMGELIGIDAWNYGLTFFDTCQSYQGHYWIDPTRGKTDTSFSALQEAFDCFAICGISDTVSLELIPGTGPLNGKFVIDSIPGNDASKPLHIIGHDVVLETSTGSPFTVKPGVYVIFGDLHLREE